MKIKEGDIKGYRKLCNTLHRSNKHLKRMIVQILREQDKLIHSRGEWFKEAIYFVPPNQLKKEEICLYKSRLARLKLAVETLEIMINRVEHEK